MKMVELMWGDTVENILHWLYIEEDLTIRQLSEVLEISAPTVYKWLLMCDIKMKIKYEKMLEVANIRRELMRKEKEKCK